jgi:hypothetical protein
MKQFARILRAVPVLPLPLTLSTPLLLQWQPAMLMPEMLIRPLSTRG